MPDAKGKAKLLTDEDGSIDGENEDHPSDEEEDNSWDGLPTDPNEIPTDDNDEMP